MQHLQITSSPEVKLVFNRYPDKVQDELLNLRRLIVETANEIEDVRKSDLFCFEGTRAIVFQMEKEVVWLSSYSQ